MEISAHVGSSRRLRLPALGVLVVLAAACGGVGGAGGGPKADAGPVSRCGLGNGVKAGGTPIKLGAIVTSLPGEDFTDIATMARAYFTCVNDNGGIHGRPIGYQVDKEQANPAQAQAEAVDLIENQGVLAMVGNTSVVDCSANHAYYEAHGYAVVGASIEDLCHTTPNYATVNMGPNYSTEGAVQYVVSKGADRVVIEAVNLPGGIGAAMVRMGIDYAQSKGLPARTDLDLVPIADPAAVARRVVQEAGPGGAVVLNFTPWRASRSWRRPSSRAWSTG